MQLLLFEHTRGGHLQSATECCEKLTGEPMRRIFLWSWFNPIWVIDNVMGFYLSSHMYGVAIIIESFQNGFQERPYVSQYFEKFQILQKGFCLIVKQKNVISLVLARCSPLLFWPPLWRLCSKLPLNLGVYQVKSMRYMKILWISLNGVVKRYKKRRVYWFWLGKEMCTGMNLCLK